MRDRAICLEVGRGKSAKGSERAVRIVRDIAAKLTFWRLGPS